jgi:uncharacterized protein YbaP (TraB family)
VKKLFLIILCSLTLCCSALAETSLWVIKHGEKLTYLGGTCHVLRPSDYPLPEEFEVAYKASDYIVIETDISRLEDPQVQQFLLQKATYQDGRSLDKVLGPQAYQQLEQLCARTGIPIAALNRFKPSMVALTLLGLEFQKLGVSPEGVDKFFEQRAVADGKPIKTLETVEQQIEFIASMGDGDEDRFIMHTIEELNSTGEILDKLIAAWRTGDEAGLEELIISDMKKDFPDIYQPLIADRNAAWLPKIEETLRTDGTGLILVGAGHMVGNDGLLTALQKRGYHVGKLE